MFGSKKKKKESLVFEASVIATMAQACFAVDSAANWNGVAKSYLGNTLLGTLRTLDLHPSAGDAQGAIWYMTKTMLGDIGGSWEVSAALGPNLDKSSAVVLSQILAAMAFTVSRSDMEETFTNSLTSIFGKSNATELEETERLACLHAGITLITVFEDIHGCSKHEAEERMSLASFNEAIFLMLSAKVEKVREWHEDHGKSQE